MEATTLNKYKKKSLPVLKKRAKFWFNRYIRLRDTDEYGYGTCISSGQPLKFGTEKCQAGHFFAGGNYPCLEFNEDNVNLQGLSDNYFKSANLLEYRKRLINKIGVERVEKLELLAAQGKRSSTRHNRYFFIEVIETYKEKCKEISKTKMIQC